MRRIFYKKQPSAAAVSMRSWGEALALKGNDASRIESGIIAAIRNVRQDEPLAKTEAGTRVRLGLLRYAAVPFAFVAVLGGAMTASGNAHPGDSLYAVKRAKEQAIVMLAPTPRLKAEALADMAEARVWEVGEMKREGKWAAEQGSSQESGEAVRLKQESERQVAGSVRALRKVKASLEAEGKAEAAAEVSRKAEKLMEHARAQDLHVEEREEREKRRGNEQDASGRIQRSERLQPEDGRD